MSKQILPKELAEIVTGLLVKPELLGELDSPERHMAFIVDIGQVVSDHCGGIVNWVNAPDTTENYLSAECASPYLSVEPDDRLPSLNNNLWSMYDNSGWEGIEAEHLGIDPGELLKAEEINIKRRELQALLPTMAIQDNGQCKLSFDMVDWRLPGEGEVEEAGDDRKYKVTMTLGNQNYVDVLNDDDNICFGFIFEIHNGTPALRLDDGSVGYVQIHAAHGGIVIAPTDSEGRFEYAPDDRYSGSHSNALLIR